MKYDFTKIMDRHNKDAIAIDGVGKDIGFTYIGAPKEGFSQIPMWVADMNFETVPTIIEAIQNRVAHPAFGYYMIRDEYYNAIIDWHYKRNHVEGLKKENIGYENGVLGCVCSALKAFTKPGDKILVHSPTYIGFTHSLEDTGRIAELSPLYKDENNIWRMDYEDMERRIVENNLKVVIFCSPHNPTGRVWEKEELDKAFDLFKKYDMIVISDEIWSDILLNHHKHIPSQMVSDDAKNRTIAIYAPSKTFNLAGLIGSYHIIYNKDLQSQVLKEAQSTHYNEMNVLSQHALIGAYSKEGHIWVDELKETLSENINYAYDYIQSHFESIDVSKPEGTYMMFLNLKKYCETHNTTKDEILHKGWDVGVDWQDGEAFHDPYAIRMNFALPFTLVKEAMERLSKYVF